MKKLILTMLALLLVFALAACDQVSGNVVETTDGASSQTEPNGQPEGATVPSVVLTFDGTTLSASVQNSGITVEGGAFVITRGGSYELRGDLSGGQIKVAVPKTEQVELIFNNFTASCNTSAPLYVESADKCVIYLAAGSVNTLTDATLYKYANPADDKPNACIYSADDLTIKGTGTLNVNGNYNNGIGCKNDLRIKDCTLNVTGVNNIVKGGDSVEIENATVKLSGGEDGIKSDATDRADKGYILITAGSKVEINCIDDAIQATVSITVEAGCRITGACGGDALNCPGTINADTSAMEIVSAS
ncbi:MAG: carbohydrate-binding domain-containing protein [Clostridia bacterium]|nr:carbohydrate-binding domain-containing protein [Clostridia bacterium]